MSFFVIPQCFWWCGNRFCRFNDCKDSIVLRKNVTEGALEGVKRVQWTGGVVENAYLRVVLSRKEMRKVCNFSGLEWIGKSLRGNTQILSVESLGDVTEDDFDGVNRRSRIEMRFDLEEALTECRYKRWSG